MMISIFMSLFTSIAMNKGVILAGSRYKPRDDGEFISINGKPYIWHVAKMMREDNAIKDIMIVTRGEKYTPIQKIFQENTFEDIKISYRIQQGEGNAKALETVKDFIGNEKVVVGYGDAPVILNAEKNPIYSLERQHKKMNASCTIGVCEIDEKLIDPSSLGIFKFTEYDNRLIFAHEKPSKQSHIEALRVDGKLYGPAGIYIIEGSELAYLSDIKPDDKEKHQITDFIMELHRNEKKCLAVPVSAKYVQLGRNKTHTSGKRDVSIEGIEVGCSQDVLDGIDQGCM